MVPIRRTKDLLVRELAEETLVYDRKTHKAHCLNRTAALVWRHCDGKTSIAELVKLIDTSHSRREKEMLVHAALRRLQKANLVERCGKIPDYSRRDLIRKLGISVAAAVVTIAALPAVAHATHCQDNGEICPGPQGQACCPGCDCLANQCTGACAATH